MKANRFSSLEQFPVFNPRMPPHIFDGTDVMIDEKLTQRLRYVLIEQYQQLDDSRSKKE